MTRRIVQRVLPTRDPLMGVIRMLVIACLVMPGFSARAADGTLDDPGAFVYADGLSFYAFDGCGDALAGRMFRRALAEKFAHCPFTAAARTRFAERAQAQQVKSRAALAGMITEHGGLPMQLQGMSRTCRQQFDSPAYQHLRGSLEQYSSGAASVEAVLPAPCESDGMMP